MPASPRRRFFLCTGQCVMTEQLGQYPDSHIIGELRYVVDEGRKVTALARYEVSVNAANPPTALPKIDVYLVGDARQIKCRYPKCKNLERWEIGKAGYLVLKAKYEKVMV